MIDLGAPFGFYSGDYFDRAADLFDSKSGVYECPVGVNSLCRSV